MSDNPPSRPIPRALPGFIAVLRGVWILTWKAQWHWQRMAALAGALLVLPALVLLTTASPSGWARQHLTFGNAGALVSVFGRRLARQQHPLNAGQES